MFEDDDYIEHYGTPQNYDGDPNGSGRYRQGSGDNPNQHHVGDFIDRIDDMKRQGLNSDKEIADAMGMSTTEYRERRRIANENRKAALSQEVKNLHAQGYNNSEIGRQLGIGESTIRNYLKYDREARKVLSEKTKDFLKEQVDQKKMVEVGKGVELELNVSREKLDTAIRMLEDEGYHVYGAKVEQMTNPGKWTTMTVLASPDVPYSKVYEDRFANVKSLNDYTNYDITGEDDFKKAFQYPASLDSKRVAIRYAEEGGTDKDGLIEIRRGCPDIELDGSNYAQVRILVDGTHYIKGMAVYSNDVPEGKDIIFNTNKHVGTPMCGEDKNNTVLKHIKKDDPENPFGSAIKENGGQHEYLDENGEKHLSVINKRAEEGDWGEWSNDISSQMLSKQPQKLIDQQLNISKVRARNEFDELKTLTNPTLKIQMLEEYADSCDSAAVELKAASFANSKFQVILPLTTIQPDQCYAPNYADGTKLALIRYPHAGQFEIPIVTVNNRNKEGIDHITPDAKDAIGIHSKAAAQLSGADFDGDTVMCIPITDKSNIKSANPLRDLVGFEPKDLYKATEVWKDDNGNTHCKIGDKEFKPMTQTQKEMGMISNLITDMTLKGATESELARAVKHSMVVIDAEKHNLDYMQSYKDNEIEALKRKYQGVWNEKTQRWNTPASTLISSAKSEISILERAEGKLVDRRTNDNVIEFKKDRGMESTYMNERTGEFIPKSLVNKIKSDPITGEKYWHNTNRSYTKAQVVDSSGKKQQVSVFEKNGKQYYKHPDTNEIVELTNEPTKTTYQTSKVTKMEYYKDAYSLSSGTKQENAYAAYANYMKALANEARKEAASIKEIKQDPEARKEYKEEVTSLNNKLKTALSNAPKERISQAIASNRYHIITKDNPHIDEDQKKKLKQRLLTQARLETGAHRQKIVITEREWEAIQKGAVSPTALKKMFNYVDKDVLRKYATPKSEVKLSDTKIRRIQNMTNSGYTNAEIAAQLGVSVTTIIKYKQGGE